MLLRCWDWMGSSAGYREILHRRAMTVVTIFGQNKSSSVDISTYENQNCVPFSVFVAQMPQFVSLLSDFLRCQRSATGHRSYV